MSPETKKNKILNLYFISIPQETIQLYTSVYNRAPKYTKQKVTELKRDLDSLKIKVGDINPTFISELNR